MKTGKASQLSAGPVRRAEMLTEKTAAQMMRKLEKELGWRFDVEVAHVTGASGGPYIRISTAGADPRCVLTVFREIDTGLLVPDARRRAGGRR